MCRRKADCAGMFSAQRQHFTWHRARTGVAFMIITDDPAVYLERAVMHEKLAAETADLHARTMHLAMAAEYRRKDAKMRARAAEQTTEYKSRIRNSYAVLVLKKTNTHKSNHHT